MRSLALYLGLALLALLLFAPSAYLRWDATFYYAQLRSPLIDGDLDFYDETAPRGGVSRSPVSGLQPSPWPIGPALLWAPFFLLAHAAALLSGGRIPADGSALPYLIAVGAGSTAYAVAGLTVLSRLCRLYVGRHAAALTAALTWAATPLLLYTTHQPLMAHAPSFFAATLLLYACVLIERGDPRIGWPGATVGVLLGLNVLLRWASVLLVLVPAVLFLPVLLRAVRERRFGWLRELGVCGAACLAMVAPQLALWRRIHGTWLHAPGQLDRMSGDPLMNMVNIFLSTNRGLLVWAPVVALGLLGLLIYRSQLRWALLAYLGCYLALLSRWFDWYGSNGFGPRYFIEALPAVALGLAALLERMLRSRGRWLIPAIALLLLAHQATLMWLYEHRLVIFPPYRQGQPLGLGVQIDGFAELLAEPARLLKPRIDTSDLRRTAPTSLLQGRQDLRFYRAALLGALLLPLCTLAIRQTLGRLRPQLLVAGALLYSLAWFCLIIAA